MPKRNYLDQGRGGAVAPPGMDPRRGLPPLPPGPVNRTDLDPRLIGPPSIQPIPTLTRPQGPYYTDVPSFGSDQDVPGGSPAPQPPGPGPSPQQPSPAPQQAVNWQPGLGQFSSALMNAFPMLGNIYAPSTPTGIETMIPGSKLSPTHFQGMMQRKAGEEFRGQEQPWDQFIQNAIASLQGLQNPFAGLYQQGLMPTPNALGQFLGSIFAGQPMDPFWIRAMQPTGPLPPISGQFQYAPNAFSGVVPSQGAYGAVGQQRGPTGAATTRSATREPVTPIYGGSAGPWAEAGGYGGYGRGTTGLTRPRTYPEARGFREDWRR